VGVCPAMLFVIPTPLNKVEVWAGTCCSAAYLSHVTSSLRSSSWLAWANGHTLPEILDKWTAVQQAEIPLRHTRRQATGHQTSCLVTVVASGSVDCGTDPDI